MGRRWLILLAVLPVYAFVLSWLALAGATILMEPIEGWRVCFEAIIDPDFGDALEMLSDGVYWYYFGAPAILVAITQVLFLAPVIRAPLKRGDRAKSLWLSFAMAGLVGAGLATGLFLAVVALIQLMLGYVGRVPGIDDGPPSYFVWIALPLGASWVVWTLLIGAFARRQHHPMILRRLLGWLFAGTIIEVLIVLPIDIMVRRKTNCYCETGTAHALGMSCWACLWLAGPGAALAVLSKRRRFWWDTHCANCGYEKGPSPGEKCPECGHTWRDDLREAASGPK